MSAPMTTTRYPGIFKRGSRYVVRYRAGGKQRQESTRTLDEARRLLDSRRADVDRGEFRELARVTFHDYAGEWIDRYQGRGRRGFREQTRDEYRRLLDNYALRFFPERQRLSEVDPAAIARFIGWLCDERAQGRVLSDSSVRNTLNPVRACFATAMHEGIVRHNPTTGAALPVRDAQRAIDEGRDTDEQDGPKAFTTEQLAAFLAVVHPRHRVMFRLLAATGLRVSELLALRWRDLQLDGAAPCVRVRRAYVRGRFAPPKSSYGRRDVPLDVSLVDELRAHHAASEWPGPDDLAFPSLNGTPLQYSNVFRRVLRPVAEEIGAPWAGFHTFRHTCASLLFASGRNAVQVQRWLGHHSPAFTLDTYVHLLDGNIGAPLALDHELRAAGVNRVRTSPTGTDRTQPESLDAEAV